MAQYSSTLFVIAAGSQGRQVTASNSSPAGMSVSNSITVGGTALCSPRETSWNTNWGSGVDIGAPSELVPTVSLTETATGFRNITGTSYAAPQVTSLAAILKSLQPNLSPTRSKQYMIGMALPSTASLGGARLTFTTSLLQALIDMRLGEPIVTWIDPLELGSLGSTALVLSRICPPGITYLVEGYGEYDQREPEDVLPIGIITSTSDPYAFTFGSTTAEGRLAMDTTGENEFALTEYLYTEESVLGSAQLVFVDEDSSDVGVAISGVLTFASCRIDERDPFTGEDPWIVTVEGTFEGVVEINHADGSDPTPHEFEGYFTLPMTVVATEDEDGEELLDYLENSCEGGIPR